jgi:hypothetical protein
VFGTRESILKQAEERKAEFTDLGLNGYIYGDVDNKPLGGTSFIYVLDAEPSVFELPEVGEQQPSTLPFINHSKWLLIPAAVGGLLYMVSWRRRRIKEKEE